MKVKKMRPPFKTHGGKYYLSSWIIENFPENHEQYDYIEPFMGGGSVFLNKTPSIGLKVINDVDLGTIQVFRALRDEPRTFISKLKRKKYSENVFKRELKKTEFKDYLDHAINEFVLRRMSRGGLKTAFAWSERLRGGEPGDLHAWKTIVQQLPEIAKKIKNTHIFNKDACKIIEAFNSKNALVYCDPPYVPETRVSPDAYGPNEMNTDAHITLSQKLMRFEGKVVISGYSGILYNRLYAEWRRIEKEVPNHSSQQKNKPRKVEVCWMNY